MSDTQKNNTNAASLFTDDSNTPHQKQFNATSSLKCFVMMPYGSNEEYKNGNKESNYIFNHIICPAINKFKEVTKKEIEIIREVDRNISGSITKSIVRNIASADICIVDITGQNSNVFFELGIRYSLRHKTTVLLKQFNTNIPFDIRGYRCITYDCFEPLPAVTSIVEYLNTGVNNPTSVDSLIFETFPDMSVSIPNVLKSEREKHNVENILPWDAWWKRVLQLASLLKDSFDNGRFVPSAILGISNGGLLMADLLGREVFKGIPILSLWADRWLNDKSRVDPSCYYFDNDFNKALMSTLKKRNSDPDSIITILLLDDLVFTSNTIVQASTFIEKQLKEKFEILFTPLYCRSIDYLETINKILPIGFRSGDTFKLSKEEYYKRLSTDKSSFPYKKVLGRD